VKKTQLDKIKNRGSKKYSVHEVLFNSSLEAHAIEYLKNQSYLGYEGINKILAIKFNKTLPFGYVLKDDNKIVGFLGTMFSERIINKKKYIYCNLHTWIVNKSHRLCSYQLLLPIVEKNYPITTFTPIKSLIGLYKKFGFETLKMKYRVVFLINFFNNNSLKIEKNADEIKKRLNKDDWKIYQDHADSSFLKFIIFDKNDISNFALIISTKVKKKFFTVFNIIYISNRLFFRNNWQSISKKIIKECNVHFLGQYFLDEIECVLPNNIVLSKNFIRDICVKNLPTDMKFDVLYSEII